MATARRAGDWLRVGHWLGRGVGGLLIASLVGCAGGPWTTWRPFWIPATDSVPGVVAPSEKMKQLKEMAESARSADPTARQQVAQRLAQEFAAEGDPLLRAEMVRTLGAYPSPEATETLRAAMEDSSPIVRTAACGVWGERGRGGDKEAISRLGQRIASDTNANVRLAATRALGRTNDRTAVPALGVALDDSDPALQRRAVLSLRQVSGESFGNDVGRWREYVASQTPPSAEGPAVAGRPDERL